ncbi:MAG: hypothetical protein ACLFN8_03810 [Candidatus Woesearchaeota archaeon]
MMIKTIDEFLNLFLLKPSFSYVKVGRDYFLDNDDFNLFLSNSSLRPVSQGGFLGRDDKFFEPSLFLLEYLSKYSKNKVFLNDEAAWLFLCGRDAFMSSIEKNNASSAICLVQNSFDENLGYGVISKHKGKKIMRNLKDRGDFLRREK